VEFEVAGSDRMFLSAEAHSIWDFEALLPTSEAFLTLNNAANSILKENYSPELFVYIP
jgi:hypothetical protein